MGPRIVLMNRHQTMIERLQAIVGATHVKTDVDSLANWACDATRQYAPVATAIVFPSTVMTLRPETP